MEALLRPPHPVRLSVYFPATEAGQNTWQTRGVYLCCLGKSRLTNMDCPARQKMQLLNACWRRKKKRKAADH